MVTGNCYQNLDSSEAMDKCYQGNGALQAVFQEARNARPTIMYERKLEEIMWKEAVEKEG